jgi:hypothetical protein
VETIKILIFQPSIALSDNQDGGDIGFLIGYISKHNESVYIVHSKCRDVHASVCICSLFNDDISNDRIALNDWMRINNKLERV